MGGVAWLSTVDYYSEICRRGEQLLSAGDVVEAPSTPEISIESLDHRKAVSYLGVEGDEESWSRFDEYHRAALRRLEAGGADFALIASNTPHHRLPAIVRGIGIPVISIFEAVARESARIGATHVLILGTSVTMGSEVLRAEFSKQGIDAAGPVDDAARRMVITLTEQLQLGRIDGAAERLGSIAKAAFERQFSGRPVVCLACTELPLAFPQLRSLPVFENDGVRYINSTIVHVNAALDFAVVNSDSQPA